MAISRADPVVLFRSSLIAQGPMWITIGLAAGGAAGIQTENWIAFWTAALTTPLVLNLAVSSWRAKQHDKQVEMTTQAAIRSLHCTDYYHGTVYCGIAVDAKNKQISIAKMSKKLRVDTPTLISFGKVRSYRAFTPGQTVFDPSMNSGIVQKSEVARLNLAHAKESFTQTGLYFELDDVMQPQVFAQMAYEDADKWMLIFEKLAEGSLDQQAQPMHYPPI